jgi:hypothetical protein
MTLSSVKSSLAAKLEEKGGTVYLFTDTTRRVIAVASGCKREGIQFKMEGGL